MIVEYSFEAVVFVPAFIYYLTIDLFDFNAIFDAIFGEDEPETQHMDGHIVYTDEIVTNVDGVENTFRETKTKEFDINGGNMDPEDIMTYEM